MVEQNKETREKSILELSKIFERRAKNEGIVLKDQQELLQVFLDKILTLEINKDKLNISDNELNHLIDVFIKYKGNLKEYADSKKIKKESAHKRVSFIVRHIVSSNLFKDLFDRNKTETEDTNELKNTYMESNECKGDVFPTGPVIEPPMDQACSLCHKDESDYRNCLHRIKRIIPDILANYKLGHTNLLKQYSVGFVSRYYNALSKQIRQDILELACDIFNKSHTIAKSNDPEKILKNIKKREKSINQLLDLIDLLLES